MEKKKKVQNDKNDKIKVLFLGHKLHLQETVCQKCLRAISSLSYNDSKIVIFVYDITSKNSFDELNYWIGSVEDKIGPDFVKGVTANQIDRFKNEQVSIEEGEKFAKSKNAKFLSFSTKDEGKEKLERFFIELLKEYLQKESEAKNKNEFFNSDYDLNNLNKFITLYKWLDK